MSDEKKGDINMKALRYVLCVAALLGLSVLLSTSVMAFTITNGTITVGSSDLVAGQSTTDAWGNYISGYDYRFSYSRTADAYAQNGNTSSPSLTGWANALYSVSNMSTKATWDNYPYIGRTEDFSNNSGSFIYKFDLSATGKAIDRLVLTNTTSVWADGSNTCSAAFYVSTDGSTWNLYANPTATSSNTFVGTSPYYDVTSYVQGSSVYYVRMVVLPFWDGGKVEIGRNGDYGNVDSKVWLTTPAPTMSTAAAKAQADTTPVYVSGIVTASRSGYFYMEDANRTSGLRVTGSQNVGTSLAVNGTMGTVNGERVLTSTSFNYFGSSTIAPLYLTNKALGGGSTGLSSGVTSGTGLNNLGLLVATTGKITGSETVAGYGTVLTIDDGSGVGVKVANINPSAVWTTGTLVRATGISSFWAGDGGRQAMIIPTEGLVTLGGALQIAASDTYVDSTGMNLCELQYSVVDDAYEKNGAAFKTGWASCVYSSKNFAKVLTWDSYPFLGRESAYASDFGSYAAGQTGSIVWAFDCTPAFNQNGWAIYGMKVTMKTSVWYDSYNTSAKWSVSPDGVNWTVFCNPTSSGGNTFVGTPNDINIMDNWDNMLDHPLAGSKTIYLKCDVDPYWDGSKVELFRSNSYDGFDVRLWLD